MSLPDLKLKGSYTNSNYETGEPYEHPEELEIEDEGGHLLLCSEDECVYILPEWVDKIVDYLLRWKEKGGEK